MSAWPTDIEFASSLDIDNRLRENVNYFWRVKDKSLNELYDRFTVDTQTLSALRTVLILTIILSIPYYFIGFYYFVYCKTTFDYASWAIAVAFIITLNVTVARRFWELRAKVKTNGGVLPPESKVLVQSFIFRVFLACTVFLSYRLICKVMVGQCEYRSGFASTYNCNQTEDSGVLPLDVTSGIMIVPILYALVVKGAHFDRGMVLYSVTMVSIIYCMIYARASASITFVAYYAAGCVGIFMEAKKVHFFLFFMHQKLQETLNERARQADEANASEMRHMIGNVAHDLKTPLSSFLSGIDFVDQVMSDVVAKKQRLSSADIEDFISSITHCISNMRNTNSFMLMTINRCIDYTKASNGVKLVPKHETIDLMESLNLPLNCMKDIQNRIMIMLEPVSREICSHIITDKQWLQENVLCLLSNAVKYSNEGTVTIRVSLVKRENDPGSPKSPGKSAPGSAQSSSRNLQSYRLSPAKVYHTIQQHDTQEYLRIDVEDRGIGLSEDIMDTLFSPFKQAQRLAGGTGLGLFSLWKRIEALEGKCGVEKRRDGLEGSLFWFQIPYRPDVVTSKLQPRNGLLRSSLSMAVSPTLGIRVPASRSGDGVVVAFDPKDVSEIPANVELISPSTIIPLDLTEPSAATSLDPAINLISLLNILVVDDSPAILKMTSMMLRRHKHVVTTATNGAEALKRVTDRIENTGRPFDVILMDLQMPVMDGLEATRRLRGMEKSDSLLSSGRKSGVSPALSMHSIHCEDQENSGRRIASMIHHIIVGVSANSDADTAAEACRVGVDAFMTKPFSLETFYRTYEQILERRGETICSR